jgi:peptidoglycan/LPS O-acetylase OafA/YrhL
MISQASMSPRHTYRPELDGLRAIAIILVIGSHAQIPGFGLGAPAGVTLFFVLSGYLITSLLVAERGRTGRVDLVAFYIRRALRLLPALYAFLAVVAVGYAVGLWGNKPADLVTFPAVVLYVGNWIQAAGAAPGMMGHTWSLAVEEQFYILWPAILIALIRFAPRWVIAYVLLAIAVLVLPWRGTVIETAGYVRAYVGTDTQADSLLLGCAVALLGARLPQWAGWFGVVALVAVEQFWPPIVLGFSLAAVVSTLAVAGAPKALGWAPLAYVGRISYGLYLWHYLFIWSGIPWPIAITAALATAAVSYEYLERPFLRLKDRRFGRSQPGIPVAVRPAAASL